MDFEEKYGFVPSSESEMYGFEYTIPDGFEAEIKNGKVIVRKKWSEDERIRNVLIKLLKVPRKEIFEHEGITKEQALAYLEKQKEQKPSTPEDIAAAYQMGLAKGRNEQRSAEWSDEDKHRLEQAINALGRNGYYVLVDWLKLLPEKFNTQPKQEWSEEDEKMLTEIINSVNGFDAFTGIILQNSEQHERKINWLKALRPQSH